MPDRQPDLIAFLRARLDEDAAVIEKPETWTAFDENEPTGTRRVDVDHSIERVVACTRAWRGAHIARHDPARVLREIDAKRRVIDTYAVVSGRSKDLSARRDRLKDRGHDLLMSEMDLETAIHQRDVLASVLRLLALPYDQHPDYREEWKP